MTQDMMTRNGYKDLWNHASTKLRNGDSLRREKVKCVQESLSVRRERTFSPSGANSQYVGDVLRFLRCAVCVLLLTMGVNVWGQTNDYSGVYYIAYFGNNKYDLSNPANTNNHYWCPVDCSDTWKAWFKFYPDDDDGSDTKADTFSKETDTGMNFLTTYRFKNDENYDKSEAVWVITKHETLANGYYIQHIASKKYLTLNGYMNGTSETGQNRLRVHLQSAKSSDNKSVFTIKQSGSYYLICPYSLDDKQWINVSTDANNNTKLNTDANSLVGTNTKAGVTGLNVGGTLGYYNSGDGDHNSKWYLEPASAARPTITNNYDGTFTIATTTTGATIYYTTNGDEPTTETTTTGATSVTVSQTESMKIIKAIAKGESDAFPSVVTTYTLSPCERPVIQVSGGLVTITCATEGAAIYYTTNGDPATSSSSSYTVPFAKGDATTIRAIATRAGYTISTEAAILPPKEVSSSSQITDMSGNYTLASNFTSSGSIGTPENPFSGTIDGNLYPLELDHPLVAYADGATIKNVILDNVTISGGTNVGAICNEATGATRIYNCGVLATDSEVTTDKDGYTEISSCSSTISGSGFVGGIVGLLDGSSRVINCFSYANITGGNLVGGIVGNNAVSTTSSNLKTMVMNCMFYGDITGGTSKAPIYNGEIITNDGDADGVNNFNYFWAGASYVQNRQINVYNCALSAETRYLQRFEFFRHLLNSNRELAAWWATGDRDNKDEMMKWVMEPSQIGTSTPYPILKPFNKYPSVVNIDADHAEEFSGDVETKKAQRNQGRKFDATFTINIQNASSSGPTGANVTTTSITPNITDKDPVHFNFNYYKVQLPYYNDVGTKNYTGNKVVTGWKIVNIASGSNSFSSSSSDASATVSENGDITLTTPYNFADRKCTDKDKFSASGRVFNQGAYFDVPEGVTSITIEPYWANCVYVADAYPDVVYNQNMTAASSVTTVGGGSRYTNNTAYDINGSSQNVYTTMGGAVTALNPSSTSTVYDNAIVLVGNVHSLALSSNAKDKPFTIMSIDLDKDNEPDYSYILRFNDRVRVHPVRIDFLNVIGLGMAQKSNGGTGTYNLGIMQPYGWFEVTNTGLFRVTQFEYDLSGRVNSPVILQGGVIEQWVTVGGSQTTIVAANSVSYYHVGGNVWFKEFHIGVHQDKIQDQFVSPHPPISVTGGDFDEFYLTGLYNTPNNNYDDNAECYINGGRFGKVAGTGMQGIGGFTMSGTTKTSYSNGNIIWQIDNADIDEFYAGGINAAHIAEGNITTVISNSRVDQFCGGPKFGDMNSDKKVVTNATNCTFRTFFGAGYGGNSYNRRYPSNKNNVTNIDWNSWVEGNDGLKYRYNSEKGGVETRIDYQFIPMSGNASNVARLFVDHISFSLATTYDVTSKLTGCTITKSPLGSLELFDGCIGNFYGGGSLGKVAGPVKSMLTNCTVEGNVFGAGYSATLPTVSVMRTSFRKEPFYDKDLGAYLEAEFPDTDTYNWQHRDESIADAADDAARTALAIDPSNQILYTNENLDPSNLGSVSGAVTLIINGDSKIGTDGDATKGNVYGGGDQSTVNNTANPAAAYTTVTLQGNTQVLGNVFGGGNRGLVSGTATVNIEQ